MYMWGFNTERDRKSVWLEGNSDELSMGGQVNSSGCDDGELKSDVSCVSLNPLV